LQNFIIFSGFVALISGAMFILFPNSLRRLSGFISKFALDMDKSAIKYRIGIGISLILSAAFLWFIAYYLKVIPLLRRLNG